MANYDISLSSTGGKIVLTIDSWQKVNYAGPYKYEFTPAGILLLELGADNYKIPLANLRIAGAGSAPVSVAAALTALDAVFTSPVGAGLTTPYVKQVFMATYAASNTIPSGGGANFVAPGNGFSNFNTAEDVRRIVIPQGGDGVISGLKVVTPSGQPANGSAVITVRKNGVDTTLTLTIAGGSVAGVFSDNTHSFSVVEGDYVSIKGVNNASTASAPLQQISLVLKNR